MPEQRLTVAASSLNLRAQPSLEGEIVGTMPRDEVVDCLDCAADPYWFRVRRGNGQEGWAASKYLRPVVEDEAVYPWVTIARGEMGVSEIAGPAANPRIVQYLQSTTLGQPDNQTDETPWCSAFVNWCMEQAGYAGTDSAWARSWVNWGRPLDAPCPGCVVVLSREGGGHVAFYVGDAGDNVRLLGGNQSNQVRIAEYPRSRVLPNGYRLPADPT